MTFLATVIVAYFLGRWLLWPLRDAPLAERSALRIAAGLAATGLLLAAAGSISLRLAQGLLLTLGVAGLAIEVFLLRMRDQLKSAEAPPPWRPLEWFLLTTAVIGLLAALVPCFAPIAEPELIATRAGPLAEVVRSGALPLTAVRQSGQGFLALALHAAVFASGDETSLKLMGWLWAALLAWACYAAGRRLSGREAGLWAAAFAATAPLALTQTRLLQLDLPLAALLVSAALAVLTWRDDGRLAYLLAAGFIAGAGCGFGAEAYPLLAVFWLWTAALALPRSPRAAGLFTLALLAGAAPWAIQCALAHHCPLESLCLRPFTPASYALFPWQVVMMPARFGGWEQSPGPWALLFGALGLAAGTRRMRELALLAIAGGIALYPFRPEPAPFLPLLALMLPVAGAAVKEVRPLRLMTAGSGFLLLAPLAAVSLTRVADEAPVALRLQPRGAYIQRHHPYYGVYQWIEDNIPRDHQVGLVTRSEYFLQGRGAYILDELTALSDDKLSAQADWLRKFGIRYVVYPRRYLFEEDGLRDVFYMMRRWTSGTRHFTVLRSFAVPRPGGEDEQVDLIAVRFVQ